ncbi:dihydrofolate reductase family protein [Pseudovibrio brasiliensis]|uniref:Dihydrofolate reductase n=1 Tax=Pseudovibrio brasiliensis TaxID=1898042 RepID=A0ABX8ALX7_9HYPH|nr:dihydrofolate reductase family protein [Pseudovibrio brasiliensis]QUS56073.1 dihydrofolate reductase [Pseudovibrio brasiliensis]
MRRVIYDVAVSRDGFIAGPNGDVSIFPHTGEHVDAYNERLSTYDTVIMGRHTYEFGYQFGLPAGAKAYPHMRHLIFSEGIQLPQDAEVETIRADFVARVEELKNEQGGDIYLCGGGMFAGLLAESNLIDVLRLKVAPVVCGGGTPLFANVSERIDLTCLSSKHYESGVEYCEFTLQ